MTDTTLKKTIKIADELQAHASDYCKWELEFGQEREVWQSECSLRFEFNDGTPASNDFLFCPRCGRAIHSEVLSSERS